MDIKKVYSNELSKSYNILGNNADHSEQEINAIGRNMPVYAMKDAHAFVMFAEKECLSINDCLIIITWIDKIYPFINDIKVKGNVTYNEAYEYYNQAIVNTIIIHRLNYILHDYMIQVYDYLEDLRKMRFAVKKARDNAEKVWDTYAINKRVKTEEAAWYAMQDHLRLSADALSPYIIKVQKAIMKHMERNTIAGAELKAMLTTALLLGKVVGNSYKAFFRDFMEETCVDYTRCFTDDDISDMTRLFATMCDALCFKTQKDIAGYWMPKHYDPDNSRWFTTAWKNVIKAFRDDDLMDKTAKEAISLNPKVQEDYQKIIDDDKQA